MAEAVALSAEGGAARLLHAPAARLIARALISSAFLAVALWMSPELPSWRGLSTLTFGGVVSGTALGLAMIALLAWRWRRIAAASAGTGVPPLGSFIGFTWACLAVNQIVPSVIGGDATRATLLTRSGIRVGSAAASVIVDRIYGLVGLLLVCLASLPALRPALQFGTFQGWIAAGVGLAVLALTAWLALKGRYRFAGLSAVTRKSLALADAPVLLAAAAVAHLLNIAIFLAVAHALGVQVPVLTTTAVLSAVFLAGVLPISIAGWGVREFALVKVLGQFGAQHDKIVLASIVYGLFLLIFQALGFFMILRSRRQ